jgi:hypothetical protein
MTFVPAEPIASGKPYSVVDVEDHAPASLDDFVGERTFGLSVGTRTSRVRGVGRRDGDTVRFVEKDAAAGKDVRVWRVKSSEDTGFIAEHSAVF